MKGDVRIDAQGCLVVPGALWACKAGFFDVEDEAGVVTRRAEPCWAEAAAKVGSGKWTEEALAEVLAGLCQDCKGKLK